MDQLPHVVPSTSTTAATGEVDLLQSTAGLTAKRIGTGEALDRWYPYYAGYSHHFASEVIAELCGKKATRTILDPWNGSGTTTAAAFHGGHCGLGFDLNPATLVIAKAKLVNRADLDSTSELLERCMRDSRLALRAGSANGNDALLRWLSPRAAAFAREAFRQLVTQSPGQTFAQLTPALSLTALCLLRALRHFAVDSRSNSTWVLPSGMCRTTRIAAIETLARETLRHIQQDRHLLPKRSTSANACLGDARALNLRDSSVDVVLTSPPYCTRIDYAKQMGFELAALLGISDQQLRPLRNQLMGTTTLRREPSRSLTLPPTICSLLDEIRTHRSHRSAEYYHRNFQQYFYDAFRAVQELGRVLRPGGRAVLVLQNSDDKEIPVPLSDLFLELATTNGLAGQILVRKPVKRTMTSVNTRARKYDVTRAYTEDLLLMEKKL